ncbi:MAG: hypothetical protein AB1374_04530 [Bacillota bacterium]
MAEIKDREVYGRQPGESAQAFQAFALYRDMGPARSIREVARRLGKSKTQIDRWSVRWDWVERAAAWDEEIDRQIRFKQLEEIKKMRERHTEAAMLLLEKAMKRLEATAPQDLSVQEARLFVTEGTKLERLSRGEPDTIVEERRRLSKEHDDAFDQLLINPRFLEALQRALGEVEKGGD